MINYIPRRYSQPKWQLKITEADKLLHFPSGLTISTPFELKTALMSAPESDIADLTAGSEHHIANWVEFVLKDQELAVVLREYNHRWGLIVALERQQMRTLNLPSHAAKYWLRSVKYPFTFVSNEEVDTLQNLEKVLEKVDDDSVAFHMERQPNDVAMWVLNVVGDYELAELLEESINRSQMHRNVSDHIQKLVDASE